MEAIFLDCGAGGPQLKRNPLGCWPPTIMSYSLRSYLLVLASFAASTSASAQQVGTVPLDSGTLIRISTTAGGAVRGRLLERFQPSLSSTLVFCAYPRSPCLSRTDPHVQSLSIAEVSTLDIAAGSHWLKGGSIGAGIGAGLGVFFIYLNNGLCDTSECRSAGPRTALGLTLFGFGLGALFGASSPRWKSAP